MNRHQRAFLRGDTAPIRSTESIEAQLLSAFQQHQRGEIEQAAVGYQAVLAADPNQPDALHLLGVVSHQFGNHASAVNFISRAIQFGSKNSDAHSNLGNALLALGKLSEAEGAYRTAISLDPKNQAAHFNLANVLSQMENWEGAVEEYDLAISLRPDYVDAHYNRASALFRQERFDDAASGFECVRELDPSRSSVYTNLGSSYAGMKRWQEAHEALLAAVQQDGADALALANLGCVLGELGRHEEGVGHLKKAAALAPENIEILFGLARALMGTDLAQALAIAERTVLRPDARARDWYVLGAIQTSARLSGQALKSFARALAMDPTSVFLSSHLGIAYLQDGKVAEAIAFFEEVRSLNPAFLITREELILAFGEHRDIPDAILGDLQLALKWLQGPTPASKSKKSKSKRRQDRAA